MKFLVAGAIALMLLYGLPVRAQELKDAVKLTKSEQFAPAAGMFKKLIQENPANGDIYFYYGRNC